MNKQYRHQLIVRLLLLCGLLLPVVVQPRAISAQSDESEPNPIVTWYAEQFGLTYEEAERRLLLQSEMDKLEQRVIDGEPTYAGSWMVHEPEFGLVVAFAAPNGEEIIQKYLEGIEWADLVQVQQSPYTDDELLHILTQVNNAAQATGIPFASGTTYQTGKITFWTPYPEELRSQLEAQEAIQPYLNVIEILYQESLSAPAAPLDEQEPIEEKNSIAVWYAEYFRISYEEAEQRLKLVSEMDKLEIQVAEGESAYAGSWMVHEPEFGLAVAFASPDAEALIQKYVEGIPWAELVTVQESPYTDDELLDILDKVNSAASETKLPFESGTNFQAGRVILWTPSPAALQSQLEAKDTVRPHMADIDFIYRESLSAPTELTYPYVLGGHPISTCTTGFALKRNSDNRRFMSTAGHCSNSQQIRYNDTNSIFLGPTVFENDPVNDPPGSSNNVDLQAHDVGVRSLDLTNVIRDNTSTTASVVSRELKGSTLNDPVCKYGKSTGLTCGIVTNITYSPSYAPGGRYVLVENYALISDIACAGDSGAPVFKSATGGVSAVGMQSGVAAPSDCNGTHRYFFYSPVDEIENVGFSILTSHYQQRYHQNVFWSETSCIEYITPYDNNGNPQTQTQQACSTAAPGSGTIETYTAWVVGNYWREAMWRGGNGYTRNVPLNNNGSINWGSAPSWTHCGTTCTGTAPRSQDAYIVGNHYYQNVFWTETTCTEYKRPLNDYGDPTIPQTEQPCRTSVPSGSSGTITSYTAYVVGSRLREGIWRGGKGYVRDVPLNATNTDINWSSAPAWSQCCSGPSTRAQGGDILSYP